MIAGVGEGTTGTSRKLWKHIGHSDNLSLSRLVNSMGVGGNCIPLRRLAVERDWHAHVIQDP